MTTAELAVPRGTDVGPVRGAVAASSVAHPGVGRLAFIDALRAMAALAVFAFHVRTCLGGFAADSVRYGWLGVQVFFAISGFVIALTVGESRVDVPYIFRFVLRRSVRLDPPYWCTIALALVLLLASNALRQASNLSLPSAGALGAHLIYAQNLLGYGDLVDVFWSLCIEFQFYLVFIILVGLVQALSDDGCSLRGKAGAAAIILFSSIGLASVAATAIFKLPPKFCFLTYWNEFFVGVLAAWVLQKRISVVWPAVYCTSALLAATFYSWSIEYMAAAATAVVILSVGKLGGLQHGLAWPPLQLLGRMSYSFYLVHTLVLSRLTRIVDRSSISSDLRPYLLIPVGLLLSLAGAGLLYWLVERPCVRLSKRLKGPR